MNFEEKKNLLNNIIENEFMHVQEKNLDGMEDLHSHNSLREDISQIQHKMYEALPNELKPLVDKWEDKMWEIVNIENRHYFREGVIAGNTNLNFINTSI